MILEERQRRELAERLLYGLDLLRKNWGTTIAVSAETSHIMRRQVVEDFLAELPPAAPQDLDTIGRQLKDAGVERIVLTPNCPGGQIKVEWTSLSDKPRITYSRDILSALVFVAGETMIEREKQKEMSA